MKKTMFLVLVRSGLSIFFFAAYGFDVTANKTIA